MHDQVGKFTERMLRERSAYSAPRTTATACTRVFVHCESTSRQSILRLKSCRANDLHLLSLPMFSTTSRSFCVISVMDSGCRPSQQLCPIGRWVVSSCGSATSNCVNMHAGLQFSTGCGKLHLAEQQAEDKRCRVYCNPHGVLCCYCCCWPGRSPVMLQVTCSCGDTPAERQLAASFLFILQQPPAELGTSNCHLCLADSLQVLDDLAAAEDVLCTDSQGATGYCKQCNAANQVWTVSQNLSSSTYVSR